MVTAALWDVEKRQVLTDMREREGERAVVSVTKFEEGQETFLSLHAPILKVEGCVSEERA